jgi:DNA polymerase-3 subunit alpha
MDTKPTSTLALIPTVPAEMKTKLLWEKELLGLYISGHPLDQYQEQIAKTGNTIASLMKEKAPEQGFKKKWEKADKKLLVAHIDTVKIIITKESNKKMAFLTIQDKTGTAEAVVFPESFKTMGPLLEEGKVAAMKCSVSDRNDRKSILIDEIKILE